MNKTLGLKLLAYSFCILALALLNHWMAASVARTAVITGLVSGGLCTLLALAIFSGLRSKAPALLTLAAVSFVLLSEGINLIWPGSTSGGSGRRLAGFLTFAMLFLSIGMIMIIAWSGALGRRQPDTDASQSGTKPPRTR